MKKSKHMQRGNGSAVVFVVMGLMAVGFVRFVGQNLF